MQRSLGVLIESSRFFVLAFLALVTLLAVACGGSDKPPLTPDDVTANALDAGDTPPADPNAPQPATPPAH
jgi:hypothetical protein